MTINQSLEKFRSTLPSLTLEETEKAVREMLQGFKWETMIVHPQFLLMRGRKNEGGKFQSISQISYPNPKNKRIELQRANYPDVPMFYASNSRGAIFRELFAKPGDIVTLSYWQNTESILVNNVGYTNKVFASFNTTRPLPYGYSLPENETNGEHFLLASFIGEIFTYLGADQELYYKASAAITNVLVGEIRITAPVPSLENRNISEFDGLMYPSIAVNANADNYALKANCVDRFLVPIRVEEYLVEAVNGDQSQIVLIDYANSFPQGKISWAGAPDYKWKFQTPKGPIWVLYENHNWVMKNEKNEIVYKI